MALLGTPYSIVSIVNTSCQIPPCSVEWKLSLSAHRLFVQLFFYHRRKMCMSTSFTSKGKTIMLRLLPGVFPLTLPSVCLPVSSLFVYFQLRAVLLPSLLPLFKSHTCDSSVVKHLIPFNYKRLVFTPIIVHSLFNPPETPSGFALLVISVSVLVCRSTLLPDPDHNFWLSILLLFPELWMNMLWSTGAEKVLHLCKYNILSWAN